MKRFAQAVLVLAIVLVTAPVSWGQFTSLSNGFTQAKFGTSPSFLGGVAFAPNGDVWADDCSFDGGTLFRFPLQGEHPVVANSETSSLTGCGLTNHPNGNLYSNTDLGVVELSNPMTNATAPALLRTIGLAGNALGITVDPQTKHLVYVGANCRSSDSCTIYDLDPSQEVPTSTVIVSLSSSVASYVDGIAFDPSGNFLFLSTRAPVFALTILRRDGTFVRQVINNTCGGDCGPQLHEPDGIAFHSVSPQFMVTDNIDGTMSRFDFPNNDFTMLPTVSLFASGGTRGDLSQVGPDGCLYLTQSSGSSDIAQICGGFAQPPGSSQTVSLHFAPGLNSTQTAAFLTNNDPANPASNAIAISHANVTNPAGIDVLVTVFYEPTELSTDPTNGVGKADGICERTQGANENNDFDCRIADGGFVFQTINGGDQVVPHCTPNHNNMCAWYRTTSNALASDQLGPNALACGTAGAPAPPNCYDYVEPVYAKIGWNTNVDLAASGTEYAPGWNNQNARLYDRRGDDPDIAFKYDITDFYDVNGSVSDVLAGDQTGGGRPIHHNDLVFADVPNPPAGTVADTVEPLVPVPGISPFPYLSGLPILVTFKVENESLEKSDPTALMKPNAVNVSTRGPDGKVIQVQPFPGFPATIKYNTFPCLFKVYCILLSPAPYIADGKTVYTLQIGSTLFDPVTVKFVVKKFGF